MSARMPAARSSLSARTATAVQDRDSMFTNYSLVESQPFLTRSSTPASKGGVGIPEIIPPLREPIRPRPQAPQRVRPPHVPLRPAPGEPPTEPEFEPSNRAS